MGFGYLNDLKGQYFPTDKRICNYFTFLHFPIQHKDEITSRNWAGSEETKIAKHNIEMYENDMKENKYKFKKDWYKIPDYSTDKFQKDIIENNENNINQYEIMFDLFSCYNGCGHSGYKTILISDFFAGEGGWLNNYKKYLNANNRMYFLHSIKTLGIELAKERADKLLNNKIDYVYSGAYEDIELNSELGICSILCYNPPYATVSKERLTKLYLEEILNNKHLSPNCFVDFVIRIDDFRECLELLLDHFTIIEESLFKAPSDEYDKFKQVVFTARFKGYKKPFMDNKWLIQDRQQKKESLINKLNDLEEINLLNVSKETINDCRQLPSLNYTEIINNIRMNDNNKNKISDSKDVVWNWFKDLTEIKFDSIGNLTVPKKLKQGEVVNLIASGLLNGQVGNHVVSGGTQQIVKTIKSIQMDGNGEEFEQIEMRKINQPYFNILMPDGNIKQLLNTDDDNIIE